MARPILTTDRNLALYAGIALTVLGAVLLRDAYENRGTPRPLAMRLAGLAL